MIPYQQALEIILAQPYLAKTQMKALDQSIGCVLAENLASDQWIPSFDNAAMDGYAVMHKDIEGVSEINPITLLRLGSIVAGDVSVPTIGGSGTAIEITTGAMIPAGYDTVIKIEDLVVDEDEGTVMVTKPASINNNIRMKGEDFKPGQKVAIKGSLITPNSVMAMSALGINQVCTVSKPTVALVTTGKELVSAGESCLTLGMIRDCNGPYLKSMLGQLALDINDYGSVPDTIENYIEILKSVDLNPNINIMISTGAVSTGRWDFVPKALEKCNADILFHRVSIKPGKPILFSRLAGGTYFFGLPGNPASVAVGFRMFVYPLIRFLQGFGRETRLQARLSAPLTKRSDLVEFMKSTVALDSAGQLIIKVSDGQESFKISSLIETNAWAILDRGPNHYQENDVIEFSPFYPNNFFEGRCESNKIENAKDKSATFRCVS